MWFFYSAIKAALGLKRTCNNCGNQQVIKLKDKTRTVKCERCGNDILPPRDQV